MQELRKCRLWDRVWRCYSWKENCQSRWQSIDGRYVQYTSMGKIWYICHMFVYAVWGWKGRVIKASRQILWFLGFFHTRQLSLPLARPLLKDQHCFLTHLYNCTCEGGGWRWKRDDRRRPIILNFVHLTLHISFLRLKSMEVFWTTFVGWLFRKWRSLNVVTRG